MSMATGHGDSLNGLRDALREAGLYERYATWNRLDAIVELGARFGVKIVLADPEFPTILFLTAAVRDHHRAGLTTPQT